MVQRSRNCQPPFFAATLIVCAVILCHELVAPVSGWRACPVEEGGGICPDENTCCPTRTAGVSSCITAPPRPLKGESSVCCTDDGVGITGCQPDYDCVSDMTTNGTRHFYCELRDNAKNQTPIPPFQLPRYRLWHLREDSLKQVHSLAVEQNAPHLSYYSSMGSLDTMNSHSRQFIRLVLIVIHGSGRNADDYLSCAVASIPKHERHSTLVLAPRFLAPGDAQNSSVPLLEWDEFFPTAHTWRYGADAIKTNISSYHAMDGLAERLSRTNFPQLERVVVAGHSAGGQFTHRWALTSCSPVWGDQRRASHVPIRVVAANPRSFCYLDGRRYDENGSLQVPSAAARDDCPTYDAWEWGLSSGGDLAAPYKDRALEQVGGPQSMGVRYSLRDVLYIAGELDVLEVHGSCEDDEFQGLNRRQRSELFFKSLQDIYPLHVHRRFVARDVPHDHCLIFQSEAFQTEIFENTIYENTIYSIIKARPD